MITLGLVIKCLLIFVDHQVDDLIEEKKKEQEP